MRRVDAPIRSPTGTAWISALALVIGAGEIFYERQRPTVATFFGRPFADDELTAPLIVLAAGALLALAWLISLYARPGRLVIDETQIRRERRPLLRRRVSEGPLASWRARLVFFSEEERARGAFKRLELDGPGLREVLLYGDVRHPDALVTALHELGPRLASFEAVVQQGSAASAAR